jgi:tripartite-type tricarboxylate transporter receptor subunit TctC
LAHINAGRLKVLGVVSDARISDLPNVPTIAETYQTVSSTSWFGVVAPPNTPPWIANRLSRTIRDALKRADVTAELRTLSLTPAGNSPSEMATFLKQESERWRSVIFAAGINPE